MDDFTPQELAVLAAMDELLADGPVDLHELADRLAEVSPLVEAAADLDADPVDFLGDLLMDAEDTWTTRSDQVVSLTWLNNGAVFTKRITDTDLGLLGPAVNEDLIMLGIEFEPVPIGRGGEVQRAWIDKERSYDTFLSGIPDWPGEVQVGDLFACGVANGVFTWWIEDAPADGEAEAGAIRDAFDLQHRPGVGTDLWVLVLECLCDKPSLFRTAVPPLTELLADIGLRVDGDYVGRADEEWVPSGVAAESELTAQIAETFGFDVCCSEAFEVAKAGYDDFVLHQTLEDPTSVGAAFDHGLVASAFLAWQQRHRGEHSSFHLGYLDAVIGGSPGGSAGGSFLRGVRRLDDGDALGAESDLAEAVRLDPDNVPARVELAWITADRGQGRRALDLLGSAGKVVGEDGERHILAEMFGPRRQGRNDPCACGSGRKYKQCCLHHPKLDESERLRFLSARLAAFITRTNSHMGVALSATDEDDPESFYRRLRDPFIIDLTCFEDGGLERYLDERGPLLDDDDRAELEGWLDIRRELWEVEDVDRGATITLRNLRTGDRTVVAEHSGSLGIEVGTYLVVRVVPTPTTHRLIGWTTAVDIRERERLLRLTEHDASADEWAMWYRETERSPEIRNREGEEMIGCHGEFWPADGDWAALMSRLDELYEQPDDRTWIETVDVGGGERVVRAVITIEQDTLVITANSTERYERVVAALPQLSVIAEQRSPVGSPDAFAAFMEDMGAKFNQPQTDAEMTELAEAVMREREEKWLDEEVPLLDGLTPREAAADPTRIDDLERLLALYERMPGGPGVMTYDVDRLRELLGL